MTVEPRRPAPVLSIGPYVDEWLDDEGVSQARLAERMGVSAKHLSQVMNGHAPLSIQVAQALARVTSIPVEYWMQIDAHYRAAVASESFTDVEVASMKELFSSACLKPIRSMGHISRNWREPQELVSELLRFTCTGSVRALVGQCEALPAAAYRQSAAHRIEAGAVLAWFRVGELAAADQDVPPFDVSKLESGVDRIRAATRRGPSEFVPATRAYLEAAGVRFVISPDIPGARVSGATRFWRGRPLVQITDRYKREDSYWFTVFHEIAHLLHDDLDSPHIAIDKSVEPDEVAANQWASEALIPERNHPDLRRIKSLDQVIAIADELSVSPGIVVGRLHHLGYKRSDWGRGLIRPFQGVEAKPTTLDLA